MKKVDCIILSMLKEERDLFLKNNTFLIFDKTQKENDFLEFSFVDKNNFVRKGVFCSGGRKMGNTEACKLFYNVSRKYKSELYINIGIVGYISDTAIGDVLIVEDCYSLSEKNVANSKLQKTDAKLDDSFIKKAADQLISHYSKTFREHTRKKMKRMSKNLDKYIQKTKNLKQELINQIKNDCAHKYNTIKLGSCATYHSVVKDEETREKIRDIRKTNTVDMEAYYFNDWHRLVKDREPQYSEKNSTMLIIKSISDTALAGEKEILEKIGSRELAMSNIYDVVTHYLSYLHEFSGIGSQSLYTYFNKHISQRHVGQLIPYGFMAYDALNALCQYVIINNKLGNEPINKNYVMAACGILKKDKQILVLEGTPGKGKSTFIAYVYQKMIKERKAIFLSIPELLKDNVQIPCQQVIYLLERLFQKEEGLVIFLDSIEGSRKKTEANNIQILDKIVSLIGNGDYNVCFCVGSWQANDVKKIKDRIVNVISNDVNTLIFRSISSLDPKIHSFVKDFAKFYKCAREDFDSEEYMKHTMRIIGNNSSQLRYIDFRLLYIFAKEKRFLRESENIFDFLEKYCNCKTKNGLRSSIKNVQAIIQGRRFVDKDELLTKNIYSRAFLFARYIYDSFVQNQTEQIQCILQNKYILSDHINLFLDFILSRDPNNANVFLEHVLSNLKSTVNCQICSKTQLLYNISSLQKITNQHEKDVLEYILEEMQGLVTLNLGEQDSEKIIEYRTLSILLNNHYGIEIYLQRFNRFLADDTETTLKIRKINLNFHLLYYSQTEFTYNKVERDIVFEQEVVYNTYQVLRHTISRQQNFNQAYIEMCVITLLHLIRFMKENKEKYVDIETFSDDEMRKCLDELLSYEQFSLGTRNLIQELKRAF